MASAVCNLPIILSRSLPCSPNFDSRMTILIIGPHSAMPGLAPGMQRGRAKTAWACCLRLYRFSSFRLDCSSIAMQLCMME